MLQTQEAGAALKTSVDAAQAQEIARRAEGTLEALGDVARRADLSAAVVYYLAWGEETAESAQDRLALLDLLSEQELADLLSVCGALLADYRLQVQRAAELAALEIAQSVLQDGLDATYTALRCNSPGFDSIDFDAQKINCSYKENNGQGQERTKGGRKGE